MRAEDIKLADRIVIGQPLDGIHPDCVLVVDSVRPLRCLAPRWCYPCWLLGEKRVVGSDRERWEDDGGTCVDDDRVFHLDPYLPGLLARGYAMSRKNSRAHRTTRIRVHGETWDVPFLFGVAYSSIVRYHNSRSDSEVCTILRDCLGLIGYDASLPTIARWDRRKRAEAHVYAWYEHLSASDNAVPRHPKPKWLTVEPWRGEGVWGEAPTPVPS